MKDELGGQVKTNFVGLRQKNLSLKIIKTV